MNRSSLKVSLVVCLGVLTQGCLAVSSMTKADTLGKGNFDFAADAEFWGAAVTGGSQSGQFAGLPSVNLGGHYGVSDSVDIGGRVGGTLIELNSKILFTDKSSNFVLSIAPSLGGIFLSTSSGSVGIASIGIPLLIGYKIGPHELTFGPRVQNLILVEGGSNSSSGTLYACLPGLSIGFTAHLNDYVELTPEAGFVFPAFATANVGGAAASAGLGNGFIFNIGLGGHFGRLGKPKPEPAVDQQQTPPPPPPQGGSDVPPPPPPPPPP